MTTSASPASDLAPAPADRRAMRGALLAVLFVAAALRLAAHPQRYEVRDIDEVSYTCSGLALAEGMTPGSKATPAGPLIRLGSLYAGARAGRELLANPTITSQPFPLRPFLAMDRALFDCYADLSGLHQFLAAAQVPVSLLAVWAAFRLGAFRGGLWGGVLLGGLVACLPLIVTHCGKTLPYSDAWSWAVLAFYAAAAWDGTRRWLGAGAFYGVSVAARVDMVLLSPLLLWELWDRPGGAGRWRDFAAVAWRAVGVTVAAALLVSPWMLTNVVGNLRVIATTRGSSTAGRPAAAWVAEQVLWEQGLAVALALLLASPLLVPRGRRVGHAVLLVYLGLLVASMFVGTWSDIRYQGAAILALAVYGGGVAGAAVLRHRPRWAAGIVSACLALPAVQGARAVWAARADDVPEQATAWVERHVPPGTVVYLSRPEWMLRTPLPTAESADRIWADVSDSDAWRRKFARGMSRYGLAGDGAPSSSSQPSTTPSDAARAAFPRALSEENLHLERSNCRRWFILGGQPGEPRPRYDLRVQWVTPTFGVQDLPAAFRETGGVVIVTDPWREPFPAEWGPPVVSFTSGSAEQNTWIFCSPDVRARLRD